MLVIALACGLWAYQNHSNTVIRNGLLDGCDRGNSFRRDFIAFTKAAGDIRYDSWLKSHDPIDLKATILYDRLAANQRKNLVVCEKAFPKP